MNEVQVNCFFNAVSSFAEHFVPRVTYVAFERNGRLEIVKSRLFYASMNSGFEKRSFVGARLTAETFELKETGLSEREFISKILNGKFSTPTQDITFSEQLNGGFSANFIPLHQEGLDLQNRTSVLQIRGSDQNLPINHAPLDWELRAADPPYDSLNELCGDFGLGLLVERSSIFEAVAGGVVTMDFSCKVVETSIDLAIVASPGLVLEDVSIGYRVFENGNFWRRGTILGTALKWTEENGVFRGTAILPVPRAAVVHCYARYRNVTHQHRWFSDPTVAQNPRRAVYERFDPDLEILRDMIVPKDNRYARDLETAASWLLWMLGFNALHLGTIKRLQEGPDLIGITPVGHHLVIECTTGQIKGESKLERLVARCAIVRDRLERSNHGHLKVLPLMVTSMTEAEVAAGLAPAQEQGVVVLTREGLLDALNRTLIQPQPDDLYSELESSLLSADVRD